MKAKIKHIDKDYCSNLKNRPIKRYVTRERLDFLRNTFSGIEVSCEGKYYSVLGGVVVYVLTDE